MLADIGFYGCNPVVVNKAYKLKKGINGYFYLTYDGIYGIIL